MTKTATDENVFKWACFCDLQGDGNTWVYGWSCPCMRLTDGDACLRGSECPKRYKAGSILKGTV